MMGSSLKTELLPELRDLLDQVAEDFKGLPDPTLLPSSEGRALSEQNNRRWNVNLPQMQDVRSINIAANPAFGSDETHVLVLEPREKKAGTIIFVHGGGFSFGSSKSHERCARVLAEKSGLTVVLPDYRLAPENPFPAGLQDIIAVMRAMIDGEVDGLQGPVYMAGDSAGANIALAAMLSEANHQRALPDGALLFYGNYAMDFETPSYQTFAEGPGLTRDRMKRYWHWYHPETDISADVLACPLNASLEELSKMPPLYLMAAGIDPLLFDTFRLHDKLKQAGRSDKLHVVEGATHGFLQYTNHLKVSEQALEDAAFALEAMM